MNIKKFWKVGLTSLAILFLFSLTLIVFPNNLKAQESPPAVPQTEAWTATITVNSVNMALGSDTVSFGVNPEATNGYDEDLDEKIPYPPPYPSGKAYLEIFFVGTGLSVFEKDIRAEGPWKLKISSNYGFDLSWDSVPESYPLAIKEGGETLVDDMRTQNSIEDLSAGSYILTIEKSVDITVEPLSGGLGTELTVAGTNFGPEEEVKIYLGEEEVGQATTDENGSFSDVSFTISKPQPKGNVTVKAVSESTGEITNSNFVYEGPSIESVEVEPDSVTKGGKITVTLIGEVGCTGKFSINGIATDVDMTEDADTPADPYTSTYTAEYVVNEGEEGTLYDITATLTDSAGNEKAMTIQEALEITEGTMFVTTLTAGPNLLHIPVNDSRFETIGGLYDFLGEDVCTMIIYYSTSEGNFQSYGSWSERGSAEDIELTPYMGLITILKTEKEITFQGGMYSETDVPLKEGINLIGLPVNDATKSMLSDIAETLDDNLTSLIAQDGTGKFVSHIEKDLEVTGDKALIVIVKADTTLELEGTLWSNPIAAPSMPLRRKFSDIADVMVVQGTTLFEETYESLSGLNVNIQNLSTNLIQTDTSGRLDKDGKYSVVFINLSGKPVAKVGDLLRISVNDPNGKFGAEPIDYRVTEKDINNGVIELKDVFLTKIPEHSALLQNYPNPFNPETWIPFQLANPADVKFKIYNLSGEVIRKIDVGYKPAGTYTSSRKAIYWDGRNNFGERVASGIYFYAIESDSFNAIRKMIVVK